MIKINKKNMSLYILLLTALAGFLSQESEARSAESASLGGSNYVVYDLGKFDPVTGANWDNSLKTVIGSYHLNPTLIESQLRNMYQNGQRKIALMLWFAPIKTDTDKHLVNSTHGTLPAQQQSNVRLLVGLIKKIGFTEIDFRFGQQWYSNPGMWSNWDEARYQENWNFIVKTRQIVETALSGNTVKRFYDLGVELGGISNGQSQAYTKRLWSDYCYMYGHNDTYGFSIAYHPGRLQSLIKMFDSTGSGRPDVYAVDVYGNENNALKTIANELAMAKEGAKGLIMQEVYYNDLMTYFEIQSAKVKYGLNIHSIMQWPLARNYTHNLSTTDYQYYYAYGGSITPSGSLTGVPCTLAVGYTKCTTQISWTSSFAKNAAVYVNNKLIKKGNSASVIIPWLGNNPLHFELRSSQGILAKLTLKADDPSQLKIFKMDLDRANGFTLLATGRQFTHNKMKITVRRMDWSVLNTYTKIEDYALNLKGNPQTISFKLATKAERIESVRGLIITISNGKSWDNVVINAR